MVTAAAALALGSAGTAAAAATATTAAVAATSATAGLFGAAGTFSLFSTISTLGTAFSIFSTLSGGQAEQGISEGEAKFEEFNARQESIKGQIEAAELKNRLARNLSSNIARSAASGIDIGSGSPVTGAQAAIKQANESLEIIKTNTTIATETKLSNAAVLRQRGRNAVRSGQAQAVGLVADFTQNQVDRGVFKF